MVRLKTSLNRVVAGVRYEKFHIAGVPNALIKELGWQAGDALDGTVKGDSLVLRKAKK
ncbi:MAG: AbrB/MazE/SpoVT family DNA-binding domain-containing protein [Thermoplasmatota archaeon]